MIIKCWEEITDKNIFVEDGIIYRQSVKELPSGDIIRCIEEWNGSAFVVVPSKCAYIED